MSRRPAGFWTKGKGLEVVTAHVTGKMSEEQAVAAISAETPAVDAEATLADVRWYAREVRKALGIPGLREAKQAEKAKQEIAAQAK